MTLALLPFVAKLGHEDGAVARLLHRHVPDVVHRQDELGVVPEKELPPVLRILQLKDMACLISLADNTSCAFFLLKKFFS